MTKDYRSLEEGIISLFEVGQKINWKDQEYLILNSDKPRSQSKGEPKTDVYLKLKNLTSNEEKEFKISCKLEGKNEFQENKIKASRAKQIWGDDWKEIIKKATTSIKDKFEKTQTYFPKGNSRTKETFYTLGWKVEIASKERELSVELDLSEKDIRDKIYKGTTLDDTKKNCYVNGNIIENSGVAEYMLVTKLTKLKQITNPSDVLDLLILIDNYKLDKHFIIFTGNNYRVLKEANDNNRPLGVQVLWTANKHRNCLEKELKFDSPLDEKFSSNQIALRIKEEIEKLGYGFKKNMI